jgi:sulfite dehydrogenase
MFSIEAEEKMKRRQFLRLAGLAGLAGAAGLSARAADVTIKLPFDNGERSLVKYPQKRPLIRITTRPPQLETPFHIFNENVITPNDAFFVRYHLSENPLEIDPSSFRLDIKGQVKTPLKLSLADLKTQFDPVTIVAVNQCSGNSRGFSNPRVAGGQMGNGAMGNARWRGVRLKDVLAKAGVAASARQVAFDGLDRPLTEKIPDFIKSLEVDHALDGEVMLAYEMNGEDLPMLNGYPLRLVVPGHYGTYWIKHLHEVTVLGEPYNGYWMNPAYRIPDNDCACLPPGATMEKSVPIMRFNVRSFITNLKNGDTVKAGAGMEAKGIAFDGGYGILEVALSINGGRTWQQAELGKDLGKYSFREWKMSFNAPAAGNLELKVKAVNVRGQTQPLEPLWNPPGYMRNVVETVSVNVV